MNNNIFKSSKNNNYNSNYKKNDNLDFKRNNYFLNKNKNKLESSFVLKEEMFPELHKKEEIQINNNSLNPNEKKNNFSTLFKNKDILEKMDIENNMDLEREKEEEGWVTLKKGISYSIHQNSKKINELKEKEKEKEEVVDPRIVFEKLTKLYENWKKNYIDMWGYEEYEKNYRFPNYDYSYLESETFEEEIEELYME